MHDRPGFDTSLPCATFSTGWASIRTLRRDNHQLTRKINCCLLNFSSASIFKVLQCRSKLVEMLFECQTAWFQVRRRVTWCLIRINAVWIWHYSCDWLRVKLVHVGINSCRACLQMLSCIIYSPWATDKGFNIAVEAVTKVAKDDLKEKGCILGDLLRQSRIGPQLFTIKTTVDPTVTYIDQ